MRKFLCEESPGCPPGRKAATGQSRQSCRTLAPRSGKLKNATFLFLPYGGYAFPPYFSATRITFQLPGATESISLHGRAWRFCCPLSPS